VILFQQNGSFAIKNSLQLAIPSGKLIAGICSAKHSAGKKK